MHFVFGIASVAMLITTIWMLAADHNRSWKAYQREFRDIESWAADARVNEQNTAEYTVTKDQLQKDLEDIQNATLSDQGRALFFLPAEGQLLISDNFAQRMRRVESGRRR